MPIAVFRQTIFPALVALHLDFRAEAIALLKSHEALFGGRN
jgi:hypothetical protein